MIMGSRWTRLIGGRVSHSGAVIRAGVLVLATCCSTDSLFAQCSLQRRADLYPGAAGFQITSAQVFDDGSGPALFATIYSTNNGGVARRVFGGAWEVGNYGPGASANNGRALLVDDDPVYGRVLLAATDSRLLRWSPADRRWEVHGPSAPVPIFAVTRHADASGSYLVITSRSSSNAVAYQLLATGWQRMGPTTSTLAGQALLSLDPDGPGPNPAVLYAAGSSGRVAGAPATDVVRWDGSDWQALPNLSGWTKSLAAFDDGSGGGLALYASGHRGGSSALQYSSVAKWDGQRWIGVDNRIGNPLANDDVAHALSVFDDGSGNGPELYAMTVTSIVRLRAGMFTRLGTTSNSVVTVGYQQFGMGVGPATSGGSVALWMPSGGSIVPHFGCPRCIGDFNLNGTPSIDDVFAFLGAWFALRLEADVNQSGSVTQQDVFDFLASWFSGC